MVLELKFGWTKLVKESLLEIGMKVIGLLDRDMVKYLLQDSEFFISQMDQNMKVTGKTTKKMGLLYLLRNKVNIRNANLKKIN